MNKKATGGHAFSVDSDQFVNQGMTLRDWFAGQAMIGLITVLEDTPFSVLALQSYKAADAMIKAR